MLLLGFMFVKNSSGEKQHNLFWISEDHYEFYLDIKFLIWATTMTGL